jgi:hypothetical protein
VRQRIALVAAPGDPRAALAWYLGDAGFDVHECEETALPTSFAALVIVGGFEAAESMLASVRSWMEAASAPRIVVVTPKPTAFRELMAIYEDRLVVLPAPAFGWDVVDALRSPLARA